MSANKSIDRLFFVFLAYAVAGATLFAVANIAGLGPALALGAPLLTAWVLALAWAVVRGGVFAGFSLPVKTAFGIFALWTLWISSVPPYFRDDLIIHLALPKYLLSAGKWVSIPFQPSSVFPNVLLPFNATLVNAGLDWAVSYIPAIFYLGSALLLAQWTKEEFGAGWGAFSAAALLLEPLFFRLSTTAYNDPAVLFFSCAGTYYFWRYVKDGFPADGYKGAISLSAGSAIKYNSGLLLGVALTLLFFDCLRRGVWAPRFKVVVMAVTATALFCGPWWVRFHDDRPTAPASMFKGPMQERTTLCGESFGWALASPVRLFFEGEEGNRCGYDGKLNPFFLIVGLLCLPFVRPSRDRIFLAGMAGLFMVSASLLFSITARYFLPVVPAMIFLTVGILSGLAPKHRPVAHGLAVALLALSIFGYAGAAKKFDGWGYLTGKEAKRDFLAKTVAGYNAALFANANLTKNDRVYFVFLGNQVYYSDVPYYYDSFWDGAYFIRLFMPGSNVDGIANELSGRKLTHVLYNKRIMNHFITQNRLEETFALFVNRHARLIYEDETSALLELLKKPNENR